MRIFVQARHSYPAAFGGPGGGRVFDLLVKGLAELDHQVLYYLEDNALPGREHDLPDNVSFVSTPVFDADIYHLRSDSPLAGEIECRGLPWVATCHTDLTIHGMSRQVCKDNWIYVSRTLAQSYGSKRFVHNGIDPEQLIFNTHKSDYLLFVSALPLAKRKGLELAIKCARQAKMTLVVAGSAQDKALIREVEQICSQPGVEYVGEVFGRYKAELFANASALLFPTQINEAFGLVLAEALMSGTPVITSDNGACGEIVNDNIGFICRDFSDYQLAVRSLNKISPQVCREEALARFHYRQMVRGYLNEYWREINTNKRKKTDKQEKVLALEP